MKMTGNTILITGGTSGIGRALAEAFHAKGNKVIIAGRRQALLDEITQRNSGMEGMRLDVEESASIDRFAAAVKASFPMLNVLINNAGIAGREDYATGSVDTAQVMKLLQTNIASVIQLTAALLPVLAAQPQATLMATSSGLAFVPLPMSPAYSASKAFLHSWLEALRFQLRASPVEVLELVPPYVQTEFGGPQQAADPRAMPLADFIAEVMQILEQNRSEKGEILVERVKHLRWAEKEGRYDEVLATLGAF